MKNVKLFQQNVKVVINGVVNFVKIGLMVLLLMENNYMFRHQFIVINIVVIMIKKYSFNISFMKENKE